MVDGLELRQSPSKPWFADVLTDSVAFSHYSELPDGYRDGWQMRLPVIEPAVYLSSLVDRLKDLDGTLTRLPLTGMPGRGIVVNCSGLSARSLVHDRSVIPVQGQVVRVAPIEGVDTWLLDQSDEDELVYVIPRSNDIVVGGTAVENNFDRHVDDEVTEAIMRRAARLVPQLTRAEILEHRSGTSSHSAEGSTRTRARKQRRCGRSQLRPRRIGLDAVVGMRGCRRRTPRSVHRSAFARGLRRHQSAPPVAGENQ